MGMGVAIFIRFLFAAVILRVTSVRNFSVSLDNLSLFVDYIITKGFPCDSACKEST